MNQILVTEKKKQKSQIEIANIVRFFAVILILFGLAFIGKGSYAIYKNTKGQNKENMPTVYMSRVNDTVVLTVDSSYMITTLKYRWNDGEETALVVESPSVVEEILLPIENSTLNIVVEEDNGRRVKYQKQFIVEGVDLSEPTIDITEEATPGSIKITATDETQIEYITYKVNDKAEIRIDKVHPEDKTINYIVSLEKGENNVTITAVDSAGNTNTEEKKIIVSGKTTISLRIKDGKLLIDMKDPDGIKDVEVILNGLAYARKDINKKEITARLDVAQGVNTMRITVTNVNSLVTVGAREFNYGQ